MQDPRLLPREQRAYKVFTATPFSPEEPTRTYGVFAKFLSPPQLEMSNDTEPNQSLTSEAYASSEAPTVVGSDLESGFYPRSTLAQAMAPRKRQDSTDDSDDTSEATEEDPPAEPTGVTALSISSREILRKFFSETKPVFLRQGHPTIVLRLRIRLDKS